MYNYTGYGMNPYQQQLTQNRIAQMEQQYNYQQPYMQNQNQTQMLKGRPVSSYDEAKASMIDLDGSLFVFYRYRKWLYLHKANIVRWFSRT